VGASPNLAAFFSLLHLGHFFFLRLIVGPFSVFRFLTDRWYLMQQSLQELDSQSAVDLLEEYWLAGFVSRHLGQRFDRTVLIGPSL